jgi:hypothetical protein
VQTSSTQGWTRRSLTLNECSGQLISSLGRGRTKPRRGKGWKEMRKFQLLGVALAAVFAVAAMTVASASATPVFLLAEFLVNGAAIPTGTTKATDSEGTEILVEETILGIKIDVLCSGIFDGTVGPNGVDEITLLLSLAGIEVTLANMLECTNSSNCPEPLVSAVDLPYPTLAELMEEEGVTNPTFVDLFTGTGGAPGYEVNCMGSSASDTCTGNVAIELKNEGSNIDGLFNDAFNLLAGDQLANCVTAGEHAGVVEGLGTVLLTEGGTLAISSEG